MKKKSERTEASAAELKKHAAVANREHKECQSMFRNSLEHARTAGEALQAAKDSMKHGEWLKWLKKECPHIPDTTANAYMRVAEKWDSVMKNPQRVADSTPTSLRKFLSEVKSSRQSRRSEVSVESTEPSTKTLPEETPTSDEYATIWNLREELAKFPAECRAYVIQVVVTNEDGSMKLATIQPNKGIAVRTDANKEVAAAA
jgi:hypothetical protein